jgi:hypothetical protein
VAHSVGRSSKSARRTAGLTISAHAKRAAIKRGGARKIATIVWSSFIFRPTVSLVPKVRVALLERTPALRNSVSSALGAGIPCGRSRAVALKGGPNLGWKQHSQSAARTLGARPNTGTPGAPTACGHPRQKSPRTLPPSTPALRSRGPGSQPARRNNCRIPAGNRGNLVRP